MRLKSLLSSKTFSVLSYLALAAIISFFIIGRYSPSLKPGDKAPLNDRLIALAGHQFSFKSQATKKLLVVNFWATWCPPCQEELPLLSKMASKYGTDISFVGAIVDSKKEDVLALRTRFSLSYTLGFIDGPTLLHWQAEVLPTTYIITADGKILWAKSGVLREEIFEAALINALKTLADSRPLPLSLGVGSVSGHQS